MKHLPELPRLLHKHSQYGYTQRASEALTMEPEAVSDEDQRKITRDAHKTTAGRESEQLIVYRDRVAEGLDQLASQNIDRRIASHVRAMQRQLAQLDRWIARKQRGL